jgi:hypothetical protein
MFWNATCVMIHLFVLFSVRECMLDLLILMKFAEASFDQDSMKKCLECHLCNDSFVCFVFSLRECMLDLFIEMKFGDEVCSGNICEENLSKKAHPHAHKHTRVCTR